MAISRITIKDLFVFNGEFTAQFCSGVNVFTGGNGTGKTTLLRAIAVRPILGFPYQPFDNTAFLNTPGLRNVKLVGKGSVEVEPFQDEKYDKNKHIFIPVNDMLSHPELYPMAQQYRLSYNNSEIDIIGNAILPITNEITPNATKILDIIKSIIGGEVIYEKDTFYIAKSDGAKIPFVLEASGFRKFGLLWKLLRNGLLESESVLFWDEPENSLNPELIPVLVDILLELSRNGVQIFIATHSEMLASYFSVNQQKGDNVMFYSLYKNEQEEVKIDSNDRFDLLKQNKLTEEPVKLYEKKIEKELGND
ncbi:AAA15 family ATPase/GTPase [Dysgonomonadaceae bacterium PH5-43]|nr:AAA15 family ATPase/GTPase [Dysgonomonadaceae bacterium PH5-43]